MLYYTDIKFSRICEKMGSNCPVKYNDLYIQRWQQRWSFFRQEMQLSIETMAAHEQLLLASLPDTLAPRWQVLTQLAAKQADFRAVDHLQALATLSDQDFAQTFELDRLSSHHCAACAARQGQSLALQGQSKLFAVSPLTQCAADDGLVVIPKTAYCSTLHQGSTCFTCLTLLYELLLLPQCPLCQGLIVALQVLTQLWKTSRP